MSLTDYPIDRMNLRSFRSQILYFNGMYGLPIAPFPRVKESVQWQRSTQGDASQTQDALEHRLAAFRKILMDEVAEVDDMIQKLRKDEYKTEAEFLTDMADWLGDIQVYCASEMVRFGLDNNIVLGIIMRSNFSKLGADGKPIISEGKVQKGPDYWKPEPIIKQYIEDERDVALAAEQQKKE